MNKNQREFTPMLRLKPENYEVVKDLLRKWIFLEIEAIHRGKIIGDVFVDNMSKPSFALVWDYGHNFYIIKDHTSNLTNKSLDTLNTLMQGLRKNPDILDYYIHYYPLELEEELTQGLSGKYPRKIFRNHYFFGKKNILPINVPDDFDLVKVDASIIENGSLINIDKIRDWINDTWKGPKDFVSNGFGYCLIKDNHIVSWCLADYVVDSRCEIGVETDEDYQRQGLATIVVSSCINHCLMSGIERIGWDCFKTNIGSIKLAEKVGFKLYQEYPVLFGWYNGFDNFLVHAYYFYEIGDFKTSSNYYKKAFERLESYDIEATYSKIMNRKNQNWFYFNAARAFANDGQVNEALQQLYKAVESGFPKKSIENEPAFENLRTTIGYKELIRESQC